MAVNDVISPPPIPLVVLQSLARNNLRIQGSPFLGANPSPAATAILENLNLPLTDAALVNETLPLFTTVNVTDTGNPEVLAALLVNQTNPDIEEVIAKQNLNPEVLAAILGNETTLDLARVIEGQNLNPTPAEVAATQNLITAQAEATLLTDTRPTPAGPGQVPGPAATAAAPVAGPAGAAVVVETEGLAAVAGQAPGPPAGVPAGAAAAAPIVTGAPGPAAAEPVPAPAAVAANENLITNPNPNALAVYLIKDPNPPPAEPAPPATEVVPPLPIASLLALGRLALRRGWALAREGPRRENPANPALTGEKSIQLLMEQVNGHMVARGLPLRFVLAKSEQEYSVDIYDCSDRDMCRIVQDIPVDPEELPTLLANLQQESGILLDTRT